MERRSIVKKMLASIAGISVFGLAKANMLQRQKRKK
jgi:hypothetical protein